MPGTSVRQLITASKSVSRGFDTRLPTGHLYACSLSVGAAHFPPQPRFKRNRKNEKKHKHLDQQDG